MCGRYDTRGYSADPEVYKASKEVRAVMYETANVLISTPGNTVPNGRFLGANYNISTGWYQDDEAGRIVEMKARWLERWRVANYLTNPHGPRKLLQYVTVSHIEPAETGSENFKPGPYTMFAYKALKNRIDTCRYDDYEADMLTVQGFGGSSEMMREQMETAKQLGTDILAPAAEAELIKSLHLGNMVGWQPFQTLFEK